MMVLLWSPFKCCVSWHDMTRADHAPPPIFCSLSGLSLTFCPTPPFTHSPSAVPCKDVHNASRWICTPKHFSLEQRAARLRSSSSGPTGSPLMTKSHWNSSAATFVRSRTI
jgi:hypothetical protein